MSAVRVEMGKTGGGSELSVLDKRRLEDAEDACHSGAGKLMNATTKGEKKAVAARIRVTRSLVNTRILSILFFLRDFDLPAAAIHVPSTNAGFLDFSTSQK